MNFDFDMDFEEESFGTIIFNMKTSGIDVKDIEEEYKKLLFSVGTLDREECIEKINKLINENFEYYKLINIDKLMEELVNVRKEFSVKCVEVLNELQEISDRSVNKYKDLVKNIYKKVYVLLKKEIENDRYAILNAVEDDYQSTLFLSELILEEVNELNGYSAAIEGLDLLNVMISAKRVDGIDTDYVDIDILQALVFVTTFGEKKKIMTEKLNFIKEKAPELIKTLYIDDPIDVASVQHHNENLDDVKSDIENNKKEIKKKLIAFLLSGLVVGGAGLKIHKGCQRMNNIDVVLSTVVKHDKYGNTETLPMTYLPKNENVVSNIIEVYGELEQNDKDDRYHRYIYKYDLTDLNFDSVDDYLNFDISNGNLKPISKEYVETDTTDDLDNIKYLNIITQNFSTIKTESIETQDLTPHFLYLGLLIISCIPWMPIDDLFDLYKYFKILKSNKKEYEEIIDELMKYYEKYKDQIIGSEFLQKEYEKLINSDVKKYIDDTLLEEVDKLVKELDVKTKKLKKNFEG